MLTTHLHILPKLRRSEPIPLRPAYVVFECHVFIDLRHVSTKVLCRNFILILGTKQEHSEDFSSNETLIAGHVKLRTVVENKNICTVGVKCCLWAKITQQMWRRCKTSQLYLKLNGCNIYIYIYIYVCIYIGKKFFTKKIKKENNNFNKMKVIIIMDIYIYIYTTRNACNVKVGFMDYVRNPLFYL
jgi:hypothetical protein